MTLCYLGLGSNLRSPKRELWQAINRLDKLPRTVITHISSVYNSQPYGVPSQPNYCNMVIAIHTTLPAMRLLRYCQLIEKKHQRIRKVHWGARTLDIDLLLYGKQVINQRELTIPHPQMLKRDFVLAPLLEITPAALLPNGEPIFSYLKYCKTHILSYS